MFIVSLSFESNFACTALYQNTDEILHLMINLYFNKLENVRKSCLKIFRILSRWQN